MFLLHTATGNLIRVDDLNELFDPARSKIMGCDQAGEEEQDLSWFHKDELVFPSGEAMPRCWTNANYRHLRPAAQKHKPSTAVEMEI